MLGVIEFWVYVTYIGGSMAVLEIFIAYPDRTFGYLYAWFTTAIGGSIQYWLVFGVIVCILSLFVVASFVRTLAKAVINHRNSTLRQDVDEGFSTANGVETTPLRYTDVITAIKSNLKVRYGSIMLGVLFFLGIVGSTLFDVSRATPLPENPIPGSITTIFLNSLGAVTTTGIIAVIVAAASGVSAVVFALYTKESSWATHLPFRSIYARIPSDLALIMPPVVLAMPLIALFIPYVRRTSTELGVGLAIGLWAGGYIYYSVYDELDSRFTPRSSLHHISVESLVASATKLDRPFAISIFVLAELTYMRAILIGIPAVMNLDVMFSNVPILYEPSAYFKILTVFILSAALPIIAIYLITDGLAEVRASLRDGPSGAQPHEPDVSKRPDTGVTVDTD